jgi:putative membrane protein
MQTACFAFGWLSLLFALDSPIHELGEQLFWVHMTQHEILMLVAAPLIVLGDPQVIFLYAFPPALRRHVSTITHIPTVHRLWSTITHPISAWLLSATALWIWHLPWLFDQTLDNDWMHAAQHLAFFFTSLLFWGPLSNRKPGMGYGAGILYTFTTAMQTSILGALLTFAPRAWYRPYFATTAAWHLTPLEDQQLGGLIMWIPGGSLLLVVALVLLVRWLNESEIRWQYTRIAELPNRPEGVVR